MTHGHPAISLILPAMHTLYIIHASHTIARSQQPQILQRANGADCCWPFGFHRPPYWDDIAADLLRSGSVDPETYTATRQPSSGQKYMTFYETVTFYLTRMLGLCFTLISQSKDTEKWVFGMFVVTLYSTIGTVLYGFLMFVSKSTPYSP